MKQYRIRCIATGEWISTRSGKSTWSTSGAAKGAYATSGTYFRHEDLPKDRWGQTTGKFDDQNVLEIVEFTLCEAGVLEEAISFLEEILENHTPWNLEFSRKIEAFIKENK